MSDVIAVMLNGVAQLEFHRQVAIPDKQKAYLDSMDAKMDEGIDLGNEHIPDPDSQQRAQFVSVQLYHAIRDNNETQAAAMFTYLADRLPDLKQVKFQEEQNGLLVDLVFNEAYNNQIRVDFKPH